jgi:hypothetical protein
MSKVFNEPGPNRIECRYHTDWQDPSGGKWRRWIELDPPIEEPIVHVEKVIP